MSLALELANLLHETKLPARLEPQRVVRSCIYDAEYQAAINLIAFDLLSRQQKGVGRRILRSWMQLAQFVAVRPILLPRLVDWLSQAKENDFQISAWPALPRGYLTDPTYTSIRSLLAAAKFIRLEREWIVEGVEWPTAASYLDILRTDNMFAMERSVLEQLAPHRITMKMLGDS